MPSADVVLDGNEEAAPETAPVAATIDDHAFAPSETDSAVCAVCGRPDTEHVVFAVPPLLDDYGNPVVTGS